MASHLVIPDVHVTPGISNERLEWVAKLALDRRPDTIVCLGDFADMASLCSYDKGKRSFEGRRYADDISASNNALEQFHSVHEAYNERQRANGKRQYRPRKVMLLGNHEDRISRALEANPSQLEGIVSINDLGFEKYGWEVVPYLRPINIDGIFYCHYMVSGVKGEAISGFNVAASIIAKHMASCTVGHCHLYDHAIRTTPDGRCINGLSAGCFFDQNMDYADASQHLWWRGLIYKHNVENGDYDLEQISIKRLREMYGNPS